MRLRTPRTESRGSADRPVIRIVGPEFVPEPPPTIQPEAESWDDIFSLEGLAEGVADDLLRGGTGLPPALPTLEMPRPFMGAGVPELEKVDPFVVPQVSVDPVVLDQLQDMQRRTQHLTWALAAGVVLVGGYLAYNALNQPAPVVQVVAPAPVAPVVEQPASSEVAVPAVATPADPVAAETAPESPTAPPATAAPAPAKSAPAKAAPTPTTRTLQRSPATNAEKPAPKKRRKVRVRKRNADPVQETPAPNNTDVWGPM